MIPESREMLLNAGERNGGMSKGHRDLPERRAPREAKGGIIWAAN